MIAIFDRTTTALLFHCVPDATLNFLISAQLMIDKELGLEFSGSGRARALQNLTLSLSGLLKFAI